MKRARPILASAVAFLLLGTAGCEPDPVVAPPPAIPPPAPAPAPIATSAPELPAPKLDSVPRLEFNRLAAELDLPLFWIADKNGSGAIDPDELAVLWGVAAPGAAWVEGGRFTPAFFGAYARLLAVKTGGHDEASLADAEKRRRAVVRAELSQGRPTLVASDFKGGSAQDRAIVARVLEAANLIEQLFARQRGVAGMGAEIPETDPSSRMLFYRNQGPWCEQPKTESDPLCTALARKPAKVVGLYPPGLQADPKFCEALEARPDQKTLLEPFSVVVGSGADLKPQPYNVAYKPEMEAASHVLQALADAITSPDEAAFKAYAQAAAQSFLSNDWNPADEAWSRMTATNSKWYLRVAPDENYFEPCSRKAGFQVNFARINQGSLAWQKKLDPVKNEMEAALAKLAGPLYKGRQVAFHLPDFIDVVLNAGNARDASGATIGESLPNWGPVAKEGRGRTVAMVNFYTDPDSQAALHEQVQALFCKGTMANMSDDPSLLNVSTVLHEASHNLGPTHEYKVKDRTDEEIFGGPLASTFEELKAQTSALYFTDWLVDKSLLDAKTAGLTHVRDVAWGFGHIARGVYTADGKPKPYSQLASIQVGFLLKAKAMEWKPAETAANGTDTGCFELYLPKFPKAIAALEKTVVTIKGNGDKASATKLVAEFVDKDGAWKALRAVIQERWLRAPKASFVYSVGM